MTSRVNRSMIRCAAVSGDHGNLAGRASHVRRADRGKGSVGVREANRRRHGNATSAIQPSSRPGRCLARHLHGLARSILRVRMPDTTMLFHMVQGGPKPVAPFSHAVECDGWVFVTGQMPDSPASPGVLPDGIEAQTRNVMANLATVLGGIGLGLEHVTMVRIYLTHFAEDYTRMNEVYSSFFPADRRPARTCIGTTGLAYDARIEIDMIARRPDRSVS
jgi:2-iminobutanoate/2-iminopropanoate deaminase